MFDLHCHILPNLDDGAKDWDESLAMCAIAKKDGIHTIVATPHIKPGLFSPSRSQILSRVEELNERISRHESPVTSPESKIPEKKQCGLTIQDSRLTGQGLRLPTPDSRPKTSLLRVLPGADIHFQPDILEQITNGTVLFLNQSPNPSNLTRNPQPATRNSQPATRNYLLLELPSYFLFPQVMDSIIQLTDNGIIPILSHPERNPMIQRNSKILGKLIEAGALSQVTAMSITGQFGPEIQHFTKKLVKKHLVHIIASDAHSSDARPPVLSRAVAAVARMIGNDRAEIMVKDIPQAVVEGRKVEK